MSAPAPSEFHFYEDTFNRLDATLATYIGEVASSVIGAFSGVVYTLLMIYMVLYGWSTMRGMISEPVNDFLARMVRLSVIVGIAMNLGRYNTYLSDFLWNTPDALAAYVAAGYADSRSNVQFLDGLMSQLYDLGDAYWVLANAPGAIVPDFGLMAVAILIWTTGMVATAYGAFLLGLSKMALAILLGIGPVFVLCLLFEGTKRFFESWIGQALNYVFLVVLTSAVIKLMLSIIEVYLGLASDDIAADPRIDQALPALAMCLMAALVMMQLPSIASALGGGVAISSLSAPGWAFGKANSGATALRPTHLRRAYHRAVADVRIARGAARSVVQAPAAVYRRITGVGRSPSN